MGIKESIKKLIPSFRATQPIIEYGNYLSQKIDMLNNRLDEIDYKNEYLFWLSQRLSNESSLEVKKRVFHEMPKATGELREIQVAQNMMLKMIKRICIENGIDFFLLWGTLLGAVRHNGFIPWDDDIDIGMMYHDYLKLISAITKEPHLEVSNYYNAGGSKIIKIKFSSVYSLYIDVFVFDYIDNNEADSLKHQQLIKNKFEEYKKIYALSVADYYKTHNIFHPTESVENDKKASELRDELIRNHPFYGHGNSICLSAENFWRTEIYSKEDVFPLIYDEIEFEGEKYPVWNNYNKYLLDVYGDIYCLPSKLSPPHSKERERDVIQSINLLKKQNII